MKNLLVLDLDETLIHTECEYQMESNYDFKIVFDEGGWDNKTTYFVKKRPYLNDFLEFAFNNFKVAIWTAAGKDYASEILIRCGIDLKDLSFLWTRDRCVIKTNFYGSYSLKDLSNIKEFDLKQILIVDDVEETASNNPNNLILIKPYIYGKDEELLKVIKYLEIIKNEPDYRKLNNRDWKSKI
jgi:RNA polymerase II subunit A small phosphatase-like protein